VNVENDPSLVASTTALSFVTKAFGTDNEFFTEFTRAEEEDFFTAFNYQIS